MGMIRDLEGTTIEVRQLRFIVTVLFDVLLFRRTFVRSFCGYQRC